MKTLAIDTSSKICGVCILENKTLINKIDLNNGLTHSESLMPLIKEVLEKANLKLSDIDNIVCDIGPGSFTGIRIGVATAMAFVDSLNLKYTGVTSLEALAYNINTQGLICSIIDAKNENCYYALYKLESGNYKELIEPTATTISNMLDTLKKYTEQITFVGDGIMSYKEKIASNIKNIKFAADSINDINSYSLALAGLYKLENTSTLPLLPLYLKKPQAKRQLEEKQNGNTN